MTKSILPSPENGSHASVIWRDSVRFKGVRFATRRMSLGQRIELTRQVRELTLRNEFLRSGGTPEQLEAVLGELLCRRLYLEWGLIELQGLTIDGNIATPEVLIDKGPEILSDEIVTAILSDLQLSRDETKNF